LDADQLAAFRAKFSVPVNVPVFGPWTGRLDNKSDSVELVKPDSVQLPPHPDAGFVPQVLVDKVHYSASAPWPSAAGNGLSLQRFVLAAYGNEPTNWLAALPTAGQANAAAGFVDTDHDGMDDNWEMTYFHTLARDGTGDWDGDGMSDLNEYLAGTDPTNPSDSLRFLSIVVTTPISLRFNAVSGESYTVQYRDSIGSGTWLNLTNVPPQASTGPVMVSDPAMTSTSRFYRIITPAQP
jgi:hypothetical protein